MSYWIPAWKWNREFIEPHAAGVALPGARTRISYSLHGQVIDLTGAALYEHPWFTNPSWNATDRRWEATVKPGFVNGLDPIVPGVPRSAADPRDAELITRPVIPLRSFRSGLEKVNARAKAYFISLGVREEENNISISDIGGVVLDTTEKTYPLPPRQLMAMDFYLAIARATYRSNATAVDASGTTGLVIDYSVTYDTAQLDTKGTRARLLQVALFPEVREPTLSQRLSGDYQDEGEDRLLISTVYLLSPPDFDGPVDGTWTPYVQHNAFRNCLHAARNIPPAKPPQPIRLQTGLLGGLADLIGNQQLVALNDLSARIGNAVNTTNNAGQFWSI